MSHREAPDREASTVHHLPHGQPAGGAQHSPRSDGPSEVPSSATRLGGRQSSDPPAPGPAGGPASHAGPAASARPPSESTRLVRGLSVGAGVAATGLGLVGVAGWAGGGPPVAALSSSFGTLNPEAAAALTLAGVSLLLLASATGPVWKRAGRGLGLATAVLGLLGIVDQIGPRTESVLHLRHLLGVAAGAAPMPTGAGATALLLTGLALATLGLPLGRPMNWPQTFAPAAAAIAVITLLAYVFQATHAGPGIAALAALPLPTAAGILLLAAGVMLANPDRGIMRPFGSRGPGGALVRRLTPTFLLTPVGVVLLCVAVIRVGGTPPELAFALSGALSVTVLVALLGRTVRAVDEADARRRALVEELASERDFTATLLQSLSEAVVVFDRDLRVIDVNSRACRLLGRQREDLVGRQAPYPWQPDGDPLPSLIGDAGDEPGADRYVRRPDGVRVPVLARMSPVFDDHGRPRAFVGTFVDVTAHKQAEHALADRAAALEQANERLSRGNLQLAEAAEFKQDLMSLMSHEVSQPLSSVASLSELLATDWADLDDDIRLDLAEKVDKNTRRLTSMINDMLLLFRLDAGVVSAHRASVPIAEVVEAVAESAPATAHIVTEVDPDLCALVDRGHLWQVLNNVVNNAMAYGEPPIRITTDRAVDAVVISVRDHGRGIAPEQVPHLFERITRQESGGRTKKGSGLGLFIVRHLVEVNGGTIWYEHGDPSGAVLKIRFELAASPAGTVAPDQPPTDPGPPPGGPGPYPADQDVRPAGHGARPAGPEVRPAEPEVRPAEHGQIGVV